MSSDEYDPITDPERWGRNAAKVKGYEIGLRGAQAQVDAWDARRRQHQSDIAKKRGGEISEAADKLAERIAVAAAEYRDEHPYDRARRSTRRLARDLAKLLGVPVGTVRHHLAKRGIK